MSFSELDKSLLKTLNSKSQGTVSIFDKGDYYVIYEQDATLVAEKIFQSTSGLKRFCMGDHELLYHNLNAGQYVRVVRELLTILHFRVELYTVEENCWKLSIKGTAGNLYEFEEVLGEVEDSTLMSVRVTENPLSPSERRVSVAFCNTCDLRITVAEYTDTSLFSQLEQLIIGLSPRECLTPVIENAESKKKFSSLLKRTNVMETSYNTMESNNWQAISELFKDCNEGELSEPLRACVSAVCNYLKLLDEEGFSGRLQMVHFGTSGLMHIDAAAVQALELFDLAYSQGGTGSNGSGTLYSTINKCKTIAGQKLLREWMVRPLCDMRLIEERQDAVSALVDCEDECRMLHDVILPKFPDLASLSRRLIQNRAKLQDCYRIYQAVCVVGRLENVVRIIFEENPAYAASVKDLMLESICHGLKVFEKFVRLIQETVDCDHFEKTGDFRITPDIDPELLRIYEAMTQIEERCEKSLNKARSRYGSEVKLDYNSIHGYCFRVTLKEEKNIRKFTDINVLDVGKGAGMRFRDASLDSLNVEYSELKKVYSAAQKDLEAEVVQTCAGYGGSLSSLSGVVATVDVLVSMAMMAVTAPREYVRPEFLPMGSGVFELENCRHPVLETSLESSYIPNDVILGSERMVILTGANMGGKSTYLRSAAICALLAQMGCRVPASRAKLSILDAIFTRVGASDQQTRGISTFMAEMLDTATILENASSNSLVIMDELGRGTSTYDGFGLAWAIASDILERVKCFCLFATHFHEMAALAAHENAKAMQTVVSVDNGQLSLLYEVRAGVAQSSFGLQVAKMVGFPQNVIDEASIVLQGLEVKKDDESALIAQLKTADDEQFMKLLQC